MMAPSMNMECDSCAACGFPRPGFIDPAVKAAQWKASAMANASKKKGTAAETCVVKWLIEAGFPDARRNTLGGRFDPGDVEPVPANTPPIIISVKDGYGADVHPQTVMFKKWWTELDGTRERRNPEALALLVHKRVGKSNPTFWHWYMDIAHFGRDEGVVKVTGHQVKLIMHRFIHPPARRLKGDT